MELTAIKTNLEYEADIESVPGHTVINYLTVKKVRFSTVKKLPGLNEPSKSPDIKLGVATRDFEEAKKILENEKGMYEAKKKKMEKEWGDLESKEIELSEEFKKNDEVIENNERDWKNQEKKTAVESVREERIQDEVTHLEEKLLLYETMETELRKGVSIFQIYEDFLQQVVHEYPVYCCVDDVLKHYESVNDTRDEMKELYLKSVKLVERMRKEVEDITEVRLCSVA
ncbi:hypothetical protein J437_LFUL014970 [Ladona fulva]|uniref:DUF4200 domain-containing protein n=1 Tax=Ladona fulva TaxID=123851 RepID=A0A8K0KNM8_LADFU|nr:hypothetical protein J437_LFUL014970 [Ladona fulva]